MRSRRNRRPVCSSSVHFNFAVFLESILIYAPLLDAKAQKEMMEKAKGKGPMNAGAQGIKKSGKK